MSSKRVWGTRALWLSALSFLWALGPFDPSTEASELAQYDLRAERLARTYDSWKSRTHPDPNQGEVVVGLAWFQGVSVERSYARGMAVIDLRAGTVEVELAGVDLENLTDVWLVDNRPGENSSAMPDVTDLKHLAGTLEVRDGYGTLRVAPGPDLFRDFDVDQVVVGRGGEGPVEGGVLFGALPLFERLHRVGRRIEMGLAPIAGEATCHPPQNNFTLDPDFISRLPPKSRRRLRLCGADNLDAIEVLSEGPLAPLNPVAQQHLQESFDLHRQALLAATPPVRDAFLDAAAVELAAARADMVDEDP